MIIQLILLQNQTFFTSQDKMTVRRKSGNIHLKKQPPHLGKKPALVLGVCWGLGFFGFFFGEVGVVRVLTGVFIQ